MTFHHLMRLLHLVGVVVWLGGMGFAWCCLRPALMAQAGALRLTVWAAVLGRFFRLVWWSVGAIALSGLAMLFEVGFTQAPPAWLVMLATGLAMGLVFASIYFGPWPRLWRAVAKEDWAAGAIALNTIRQRVGINLVLGGLTMLIATLGLSW